MEIVRRLSKACTQQKTKNPDWAWCLLLEFVESGSKNFGGFLTLCSSILSPTSTGCQIVGIVKLDWIFINIYANPKSFQAILNSLKLSLIFLLNHSKIIMTGDFIALSYGNFNSSSIFKLYDARIKPITQLKKQIFDYKWLCWFRNLNKVFAIIYFMAKNTKVLRA